MGDALARVAKNEDLEITVAFGLVHTTVLWICEIQKVITMSIEFFESL